MDIFLQGILYYLLFNTTYHLSSFVIFCLDYSGCTAGIKLQKSDRTVLTNTYKKVFPVVLLNTLVYSIPTTLFLPVLINYKQNEFDLLTCVADIIFSLLLSDLIFFLTHRLLHAPRFYATYHKLHHEITAPVSLSATYLTPLDFYSNILSIYLPPIALSAHEYTMIAWVVLSTLNTVIIGHGGFAPISSFHDKHHEVFNCNYGIGLWADKFFGSEYSERKTDEETETLSESFS